MRGPDYLEDVYVARGLGGVDEGVLVIKLGGAYIPYYWLPFHVLGRKAGTAHIRVFKKNPGLRKLYELFLEDKARYIVVSGRRVAAATPRSMFFHVLRRAPSTASLLSFMARNSERCLSYLSTVKTILERMSTLRSGHIPLCRGGRIVYVATAAGIARYLDEVGHTATRASSLGERYLLEPPHASDIPSFLSLLRRFSFGVYDAGSGRQVFASEHVLYEAVRRALLEGSG